MDGFQLVLTSGKRQVKPGMDDVRVRTTGGLELTNAAVVKLPRNGAIPPIDGMIVAGDEHRYGTETFLNELQARKPSLILLIGKSRETQRKGPARPMTFLAEAEGSQAPVIRIRKSDAASLLAGEGSIQLTVHIAKPVTKEFTLRNVVALLRGSDDSLRNQYVLLTAHYDHLGRTPAGIFHGANDDGSGTVSVIEIGRAMAAMNPRPKRSIIFMTVFGEEEGLLGSRYYVHHPLVPLKETVAEVNLEQMGRTDEKTGTETRALAFTGSGFSDLPEIMGRAAKTEHVNVYKRGDADDYFDRSDNFSFAQYGVIAHTIAVAFEYPDYHALGDTVDKIDFANMAAVDKGVAAGIVQLADEPNVPQWSSAKGAAPYRGAGH